MNEEFKAIASGLKAFLKNTDEEELILKAAPAKDKAAFNSRAQKKSNAKKTSSRAETKKETPAPTIAASQQKEVFYQRAIKQAPQPVKEDTPVYQSPIPTENQLPQQKAFDKAKEITYIAQLINGCKKCPLGETRIKAVPGEGNINAKIMFIGEGPGYEEDRQGRPFVGRAGQLLDKMIIAMGFERSEVFIANIVKCHPMIDPSNPDKHGNDRPPKSDEIAVCRHYLENQIKVISPDYIVALGGVATKALISESQPLGSLRGKIFDLQLTCVTLDKPIKILATFHPAALLRNPGWKKEAWENLKVLLADMGRKPAAK